MIGQKRSLLYGARTHGKEKAALCRPQKKGTIWEQNGNNIL